MDLMSLMIKIGADVGGATKGIEEVQGGMEKTSAKASSFSDKLKTGFNAVKTGAIAMGAGFAAAAGTITKLATDAASTTDHIDKMSQKIGLSRKAYQEMDYVMSQSGGSVDSLQAGMKTLRTSMSSNEAQFKALGVAVKDSSGNMRSTEDVMFDTISALQNVENETERATLASKLFGKSGAELAPLLNAGAGSIDALRQKANELGLVLEDDAIDAGVKLTDTIDNVKRSFSSITTKIGVSFMPMVQTVLDAVLDNMPKIQSLLTSVFRVLSKVVTSGVNLIKKLMTPISSLFTLLSKTFASFDLKSMLSNLFTGSKATSAASTSIYTFVNESLKPALKTALEKLFGDGSAAESIVSVLKQAIFSVQGVIKEIETAFEPTIAAVKELYETVKGLFSGENTLSDVGTSLYNVFKNAWTSITSINWSHIGSLIGTAIKSVASLVVDWAKTMYTNVSNAISSIDWYNVGTQAWNLIKSAFSAVVSWFKSLFGGDNGVGVRGTIEKGVDWAGLGTSILNLIKSAFSAVWKFFLAIWIGVRDTIKGIDWAQVGTDIWNWIKGAFEDIGEWFREKFDLVVSKIKEIDWAEVGTAIWDWIKGAFEDIGGWFKEAFEPVVTKIKEIDWAEVGTAIWDWITGVFSDVGGWFKKIFEPVATKIEEIDWAQLGTDIWDWITGAFSDVGGWFREAFDLAVTKVKEIEWAQLGTDIWEAIKGALEVVESWLPEDFQTALDTLETFFTTTLPGFVNTAMMYFNAFKVGVLTPLGDYIGGKFIEAWTAIKDYWETDLSPRLQTLHDAFDTFKANVLEPIATFLSDTFTQAWEGIKSLFGAGEGDGVTGSLSTLSKAFNDLYEGYIKPVADYVSGTFSTVWETWTGVINGIITFLTGTFSGEWEKAWDGLVQIVGSVFDGLKNLLKAPINAVIDLLNSLIAKVESAINTVINGINNKLKIDVDFGNWPDFLGGGSLGGIHWGANLQTASFGRIQKLAKGGTVLNGGHAIVGEAGPEYLRVVNGQAVVTPMKGLTGGGDTYNNSINIYQQPGENAEELAERVQRVLARQQRQRRSVYA